MNYFGHVALASGFSSSPEFLLGSMLPDLASIIGKPIPQCLSEAIRQGVRFHLLTDDEFHQAVPFRVHVESSRRALELLGLRKPQARAVSHVGVELILDAALSSVTLHGLAFRTALRVAAPRGVADRLQWTSVSGPDQFEALRLRLIERSTCRDFFAKERLVDRLVFALSHRPRLRLSSAEQSAVLSWIDGRSAPLGDELVLLWDQVRERVGVRWQRQSWPDLAQPSLSAIQREQETMKLRQD
jgi:hypothetical protein